MALSPSDPAAQRRGRPGAIPLYQVLSAYLPQDRLRALARGETLPDRATGTGLFADISGFTPLTERLIRELGARRGTEELTKRINAVYDALIEIVDRRGGSVVSFAGDAITCWFDMGNGNREAPLLAVQAGLAMQQAMSSFPDLSIKVAVATGSVRRFIAGDPQSQLLDTLAGQTIERLARAERLAYRREVIADVATIEACGDALQTGEWHHDADTGEGYAVVVSSAAVELESRFAQPDGLLPEVVRAWVLPTVYSREQGGLGEFLTELRPAVALFLRFDGIDYDHDESARQKLDALVRQVQGVMARYDGTLLELTIGDKGSYLYACFGAPVAHEDDARRAAEAAVALRDIPRELTFLRPVQIGISRGTVRAGAYGGTTRRSYGALGDEVNVAARLMSIAAPGEILLTGAVQRLLGGDFSMEARRPVTVKGKTDPIPVFALNGLDRRPATRLLEPAYSLPMIGRQEELDLISGKLQLARQARGEVIGITAEAGMGKSRLVAEAIRLGQSQGFVGYGGSCESSGTNTPYLPWKSVWQTFFRIDPDGPVDDQSQHLERRIRDLAPDRLRALPLLSPVLDLEIEDNDFVRGLEPKDRRNALGALLEDCLKAAAREKPVLIVLEDVHWVDQLSYDLLETLARTTANSPVCFVLAYRPFELEGSQAFRIEALPQFTSIVLSELPPADAERLIRAKAEQLFPEGAGAPPEALIEQLTAKAQGNPFFLEELLNYLHDRGIDPSDLDGAETLVELPNSLHTLILSRIDQLTESQKATLKVASIIGRQFSFLWLRGYYPALGAPEDVKDDLDALVRLDITPLDIPEPEPAYLFKHIVTQEVAYESLAYATRAQLHEQLARYLEEKGGEQRIDLLAFHYGRSENVEKQREYFRKAGDAARATYANAAALEYYERLLRLTAPGDLERIYVLLELGQVLQLVGRWEAAEGRFREAYAQAEEMHERLLKAKCEYALGRLMVERQRFADGSILFERARTGFEEAGDQLGLAETLNSIADIEFQRAKGADMDLGPAKAMVEESIRIARQLEGGRPTLARALSTLSGIAFLRDYNDLMQSSLEESLAIRREIGDRRGMAQALHALSVHVIAWSGPESARPFAEESLSLYRQIGDRFGAIWPLGQLGWVEIAAGQYGTARDYFEECLAFFSEQGSRGRLVGVNMRGLGAVNYLQADFAAAQDWFEQALEIFRETGDTLQVPLTLFSLALALLEQGDTAQADRLFSEGMSLARKLDDKSVNREVLIVAARLALVRGELVRAARLSGAAEAMSATLGSSGWTDYVERYAHSRTIEELKQLLDAAEFAVAWTEGQAMTVDEALRFALEEN